MKKGNRELGEKKKGKANRLVSFFAFLLFLTRRKIFSLFYNQAMGVAVSIDEGGYGFVGLDGVDDFGQYGCDGADRDFLAFDVRDCVGSEEAF